MAQPKKRPFVSLKGLETGRVTSSGKPVYKYKGEEISEKSIDIEADGKTYVIPTVIDGKLYTEEAAVAKFFNKEVEPIKVLKENIKERSKKLSKGGNMKKQMDMFEDGGLKDEGGMIDEVSGNDVPSGSTREEVRDDIPAQLSEGEFVFPADVVRFIGLEKLMQMRQKAKMGLQKMEDMGQMGNSEEAIIPDDVPFNIDDLDIEEEVDNEAEMEYNKGGVVYAQQGAYIPNVGKAYQPPAAPNAGTPYAPATFTDLLGTSAGGAPKTQNVRYVNEATGQVRMIPHVLNPDGSIGNSLYPKPDGFVRKEDAPKEAAKPTQVQSTKVAPVDTGDGDGDGDSDVSTLGGARMDVGGREFAVGYNFDGSVTLTDPKTMEIGRASCRERV